MDETKFLDHLENYLMSINLDEHLLIIGDLNMDLRSKTEKGDNLLEFMNNNEFKNCINNYTRIAKRINNEKNEYIYTQRLIDAVLHNKEIISKSTTISCPFSDHHFVLIELDLQSPANTEPQIECRSLTKENLVRIVDEISLTDWSFIDHFDLIDDKWLQFKTKFMTIISNLAPYKKIKLKNKNMFP